MINFLEKHLKKYPEAHIYHYNTYEKRAIREMSSAYSKDFPKADIINDDWLRGEKYVDLFRIATQSIRTSEKDMSLKSLEQFYKFERKADIVKADDSVVKYDNWIATKNDKYKQDIINYNKEDCISTYELREFLIQKKPENIDWFFKNNEVKKENNYVNKYSSKNSKKISREETEIDLNKRLEKKKNKKNNIFVENLQNLVGFHWRDNKPDHWEVYDRQEKSHLELEEDTECIANCVLQNIKPKEIDVGYIYSYKFNDQNYKLKKGSKAFDVHEKINLGTVYSIKEKFPDKNILEIIVPKKKRKSNVERNMPDLVTFGKDHPPQTHQHGHALNKFIEDYIVNEGKNYKCVMDMLERRNPDISNLNYGSTN